MTRPLTPGAYLKARRTAHGLSIEDVATRLATEPRYGVYDRAEWIALVEADVLPATYNTIVALHEIVRFDPTVLHRLAQIQLGEDLQPPQLCRICACSDRDARFPACAWAEVDLCTACSGPDPALRQPIVGRLRDEAGS